MSVDPVCPKCGSPAADKSGKDFLCGAFVGLDSVFSVWSCTRIAELEDEVGGAFELIRIVTDEVIKTRALVDELAEAITGNCLPMMRGELAHDHPDMTKCERVLAKVESCKAARDG